MTLSHYLVSLVSRTSETIGKFLPPKTVNVVMCRPSAWQARLFRGQVEKVLGGLGGEVGQHLATIATLKKICNSPLLLEGEQAVGGNILYNNFYRFTASNNILCQPPVEEPL